MTVTENLEMGAFQRSDRTGIREDGDRVFELFPRLHERRSQKAGTIVLADAAAAPRTNEQVRKTYLGGT